MTPAVRPPCKYFSAKRKTTITGTVAMTESAIKCCLGTSSPSSFKKLL